jgi:hypothetical protein
LPADLDHMVVKFLLPHHTFSTFSIICCELYLIYRLRQNDLNNTHLSIVIKMKGCDRF